MSSLCPDVACVSAYGALLPKRVLELPRYGCLNVHGSLLPRWRGAAPIERAILAVRNARIARAYETHKTARELAAEHRMTERQIERILAAAGVKAPVDRRQGSLF